MPASLLPSNYTTVQVRGHYVDMLGQPVEGQIVFTPSVISIQDGAADTTIVGKPVSVALDKNTGSFTVDLPATDDPDTNPSAFTYQVEEKFTGFNGRKFSFVVPSSMAGSGIELSQVAPVNPAPGVIRPYFLNDLFDVEASVPGTPGTALLVDSDGTWRARALTATDVAATEVVGSNAWLRNRGADLDALVTGVITRDANNAATTAAVTWPDGTPGTYTALVLSTTFPGAVDSYKVTYGSPVTKTVTQPTVTRNAAGAVTTRPALTVA